MTEVIEATKGQTRDLPIDNRLRELLKQAGAVAGVDTVRVFSGDQCAKGTCSKRTGSTRHDLGKAADLELLVNGKRLDFTDFSNLSIFELFVTEAARLGATGIGAGVGYMGVHAIHVGFGARAVWGKDGSAANAPDWLRAAAESGWGRSTLALTQTYRVVARKGLHLRSGPGVEFKSLSLLEAGSVVRVESFDGPSEQWAKTDLHGDGLIDGHVHRSLLLEIDPLDSDSPEQEDCGTDAAP